MKNEEYKDLIWKIMVYCYVFFEAYTQISIKLTPMFIPVVKQRVFGGDWSVTNPTGNVVHLAKDALKDSRITVIFMNYLYS